VLPPAFTGCELGLAETVKSGEPVTVKVTMAVCVSAPLVPVMVSVELPDAVLAVVVTVSVELPVPLTDAGLNTAVAPGGSPLTLRFMLPAKPF
jgi:hypothetical protein